MHPPIEPIPTYTQYLSGTKRNVLIGIVAVVLLGLIGWYAFTHIHLQSPHTSKLPADTVLYGAFGKTGVAPLYRISSAENKAPEKFSVAAAGGKTVTDWVEDADTVYYVLLDQSTNSSNIYAENKSNPSIGLRQVTKSSTLKINLSVDPTSHDLVYQSTDITNPNELNDQTPWRVTVLSASSGRERVVALGSMPSYVNDQNTIVYLKKDSLVLHKIAGSYESTLLSVPTHLYALRPDGESIALYNATTTAIDIYSLVAGSVSYQRSEKLAYVPKAIVYAGNEVVSIAPTREAQGARSAILLAGNSQPYSYVISPDPLSKPQKLIVQYEK